MFYGIHETYSRATHGMFLGQELIVRHFLTLALCSVIQCNWNTPFMLPM
jgi:hypothetical protein